MSDDQADETLEIAKAIFVDMASDAGPDEWDWEPIASKSCEAAEVFLRVSAARYTPQSATQGDANGTPLAVPAPGDPTPAAITPPDPVGQ